MKVYIKLNIGKNIVISWFNYGFLLKISLFLASLFWSFWYLLNISLGAEIEKFALFFISVFDLQPQTWKFMNWGCIPLNQKLKKYIIRKMKYHANMKNINVCVFILLCPSIIIAKKCERPTVNSHWVICPNQISPIISVEVGS